MEAARGRVWRAPPESARRGDRGGAFQRAQDPFLALASPAPRGLTSRPKGAAAVLAVALAVAALCARPALASDGRVVDAEIVGGDEARADRGVEVEVVVVGPQREEGARVARPRLVYVDRDGAEAARVSPPLPSGGSWIDARLDSAPARPLDALEAPELPMAPTEAEVTHQPGKHRHNTLASSGGGDASSVFEPSSSPSPSSSSSSLPSSSSAAAVAAAASSSSSSSSLPPSVSAEPPLASGSASASASAAVSSYSASPGPSAASTPSPLPAPPATKTPPVPAGAASGGPSSSSSAAAVATTSSSSSAKPAFAGDLAAARAELARLGSVVLGRLENVVGRAAALPGDAGDGDGPSEVDRAALTEAEDEVRRARVSVSEMASALDAAISGAVASLGEKDRVIKELRRREQDVASVLKEEQPKLHVDYESGLIKTPNGTLGRGAGPSAGAGAAGAGAPDAGGPDGGGSGPKEGEGDGAAAAAAAAAGHHHQHAHGEPLADASARGYDPAVLMEDFVFLTDFVTLVFSATVGGVLAVNARFPIFVGFIAGGMVVGPSGLAMIQKLKYVETLSQIGGPLLLFAQALSLQNTPVSHFNHILSWAVPAQFLACTLAMCAVLGFFDMAHTATEALLLALCTTVSSSAVSLKIAEDNGHAKSAYYQVLLTLAMVQDLIMALLLCLPAALAQGILGLLVVLKQMTYVMFLVSTSVLAAVKVVPRVARYFVNRTNPELFLLSMLSLCLGAASFTRSLGLSTEFGAFFAGLILTRTSIVKDALHRIDPIKEVFCAMFFASIGLVISWTFLWKNAQMIVCVWAAVLVVKVSTSYAMLRALGQDPHAATMTALCLGEIGEFSIFVTGNGFMLGVVSRHCYLLFLGVTVFSLVATPLLVKALLLSGVLPPPPRSRTVIKISELGAQSAPSPTHYGAYGYHGLLDGGGGGGLGSGGSGGGGAPPTLPTYADPIAKPPGHRS